MTLRTEYRLWEWPPGKVCGVQRDLYPTVEAAMHAVGIEAIELWHRSAGGGWHIPLPDGDRTSRYQSHAISPEQVPESVEDRVQLAVETLMENGQYDGEHHKMWTIDQALRILFGDTYDERIAEYCAGEDGPETYSWDVGIAP